VTQAGPTGIVIGDFNGDGHQDVLVELQVAYSTENIVQVYLGWGDGTLQLPATYSPPERLSSLVAADLNGDGRLDIVSRGVYNGALSLLQGIDAPFLYVAKTHSGTFTQGQTAVTATINVSNDPFALPTSGLVAVKEYLPGGLTLTSMNGLGWTCVVDTCSRSDSLGSGGSYPPITITADVHSDAQFSEPDYAISSGGGSLAVEGFDTLIILQTNCTFSISAPSDLHNAGGGAGSVRVTAPDGCSWTATSNAAWLTVTSGASGSGIGTVSYASSANPDTTQRIGTLTIAGQTLTVTQSGVGTNLFYSASARPGNPFHNDSATTVGVKFRSDVSGTITGLRYYKQAPDNTSHVGLLYAANGTLLAQVSFPILDGQYGWQQVNLPVPVAISPNTTYIAAYSSPSGFSYDASYFTNGGVDNPPLHALRSGVDGGNGVYIYGDGFQFPTLSSGGTNYWADVVFASTVSPGPDLTITKTHTGSFTQGQTGSFTITVTNSGGGPTSGAVTVTENLPSGLEATSMVGTDWFCAQPVGPCIRSDALGSGSAYPPITLTVHVVANAPSSVTNTITVSGGGETNTSNDQASDPTTILSSTPSSSIWASSAVPGTVWHADSPATLGVKFRSDVNGTITGIRFYKGAGNNGTHIGLLYTTTGTLLGQVTFTGETSAGWQQASFSAPVAISANTTYVAAYFSASGFAFDPSFFTNSGVDNSPLHALRSGVDGLNGVYIYGSSPQFPASSSGNSNYWADVVFSSTGNVSPDLTITKTHTGNFAQGQMFATYAITVRNIGNGPTTGVVTVAESLPVGLTATSMIGSNWNCIQPSGPCSPVDALGAGASYPDITLTVNVAANAPASVTNVVTVSGGGQTNTTNDQASDPTTITSSTPANSIWAPSTAPGTAWHNDSAVTVGVKFRSDSSGTVTGIRFYKGAGNNGPHVGLLYSANGTLLGQVTFTGETASGWQQANFSAPITISANTTYIAAYFSTSGFAFDPSYFTNTGVDNPPLHALRSGVDGLNGVYMYGGAPQFPASSAGNSNYWADVVFSSTGNASPDLTITKTHTGNFMQGQTGATYTITAHNSGSAPTNGTVTVTETLPPGLTATSMLGSNWTCTQPSGPCTRSDILGAGSAYPDITLTVNVAAIAPPSTTNVVIVSGGGETNTSNDSATDPTTILSSAPANSVWASSVVPGTPLHNDSPVTLGMKFRSDVSGAVTGIRFYKGAGNNGTHTGLLYTASGTLMGLINFTGETASGWQEATFPFPMMIAANTTYVAAYFSSSGFAFDPSYFTNSGVDNPPLHALRSGVDGPNGMYIYGSGPQFPSLSAGNSNYWVDVAFSSTFSLGPDLIIAKTHAGSFTQGQTGATYTITVSNSGSGLSNGLVTVTESLPAGLTAVSMLGNGWTCTQPAGPCSRSNVLAGGAAYPDITLTVDVAGNAPSSVTNTVTVSGGAESNTSNDQATDPTTITSSAPPSSIWTPSTVPGNAWHNDSSVTLGVKFRSDSSGSITGIRFYKGAGNNGTHIGLLYNANGTLLGQATFTGESASGWQQANFAVPVAISANTTYIGAYFSTSGFAFDPSYFTNAGVDNSPLHALRSGVDGPDGVYMYGSTPQFPASNAGGSNYWADVVFTAQ